MCFLRTSKTLCIVILLGISVSLSAPAIHAQDSITLSSFDAKDSTTSLSIFELALDWLNDWTFFGLGNEAQAVDPGILDFSEGEGENGEGGDIGSGLDPNG